MQIIIMVLILALVLFVQFIVYKNFGLKNIRYSINFSKTEAFEDEEIEIVEEIENAKALPLPWVRTEINCSRWLTFTGYHGNNTNARDVQKGLISGVFMLKGYQKIRRSWRVKCEKRGIFRVEDISLAVSDLFGLIKPTIVFKVERSICVLPLPANINAPELSSETYIGDISVNRFVQPDPFVISGAKEYTGREPMNRIHWSQSARLGKIMVYNNEYTTERRMLIIMNMQRTFHSEREKLPVNALETQIKGAAFMLDYCYSTHTPVAFTANTKETISIEPLEGYEHNISVLRTLAYLKNSCGCHIDDFMQSCNFADYTDIIFITRFLTDITVDILQRLSCSGKTVTILSTEISECDFCEVIHLPRAKNYPIEGGEE
ncbi:MAG: DUF58 domain-containing protein [Oscillospiraceae bacterium]